MRTLRLLLFVTYVWFAPTHATDMPSTALAVTDIPSPILFRGDATTAYRDPAAIYHDGWFRLFFTLVKIEPDKKVYSYTAWSKSRDLVNWSDPKTFTQRDQSLNFGSPGNIVRQGDEWVLCLQTYPRPNGEAFGNAKSRIWAMRSKDLETWSEPELLRVKGPEVFEVDMGRMIDPYLIESREESGKWWCFYKQNGISMSWSFDLKKWTPAGQVNAGENPCIIPDGNNYLLFHSPKNGIGIKRSSDFLHWQDQEILTLGQKEWPWAQGRITAGFVLDLRQDPHVSKALMFFHGSEFPEKDPRGGFDNYASIGIAWSNNLKEWEWPHCVQAATPERTSTADVSKDVKPTLSNVSYATASSRQKLDYWKASAATPTPVVIYFHSGSWEKGDKKEVHVRGLSQFLRAGISVVSVDYRFIAEAEKAGVKPPVKWPLEDAARAVQFVRSKAAEWGIDKNRVAFSGLSAGACSSLWLGMHDDFADPKSNDPVARESTRAMCVGVVDAQTTLDPRQMREWFGKTPVYGSHAFGFHKGKNGSDEDVFKQLEEAREEITPWIHAYSPIEQASSNDPPICLFNLHKPPGDLTHGAQYGVKLKAKLDSLHVECETIYPGAKGTEDASQIEFLIRKLQKN